MGISPPDLPEQAAYHSNAGPKKIEHGLRQRSRIRPHAVAPRSLIDAGCDIQESIGNGAENFLVLLLQIETSTFPALIRPVLVSWSSTAQWKSRYSIGSDFVKPRRFIALCSPPNSQ